MKKNYQIKTVDAKGKAITVAVQAGVQKPVVIDGIDGARYQLVDDQTGYAPENIRAKRIGKDLYLYAEGDSQPSAVIEGYYNTETSSSPGTLVGQAENNNLYTYTPETALDTEVASQLADGAAPAGMALGGDALSSGAALAILPAAAGFAMGPLGWAGIGLLGAAALGGGGGGGGGSSTPPLATPTGKLGSVDTGPAPDNITTDQTPIITGTAPAYAAVAVTVNGHTYDTTANASGIYNVEVTDPLPQGAYTPHVKATLNGISSEADGTGFVVDLDPSKNYSNGAFVDDPNTGSTVAITSIDADTNTAADFITSDQTLVFHGSSQSFSSNGDKVLLTLLSKANDRILTTQYVTPAADGTWSLDYTVHPLDNGTYTLKAQIVDGAGNPVTGAHTLATQDVVINTNLAVSPSITDMVVDSGTPGDYITNDTTPTFTGTLGSPWNSAAGDTFKVQVFDNLGQLVGQYGSEILAADKTTWTTTDTAFGALADGLYSVRAVVTNSTGQVMSMDQHNFLVDTVVNALVTTTTVNNTSTIQSITINPHEAVNYSFTNDPTALSSLATGTYDNTANDPVSLNFLHSGTFAINQFHLTLTDIAGNTVLTQNLQSSEPLLGADPTASPSYSLTNGTTSYVINSNSKVTIDSDLTTLPVPDVTHAGVVGQYTLDSTTNTLDLSTLINKATTSGSTTNTTVACDLVDMSAASTQELTLKLNDVLSLGVINAFDTQNNREGHVQFAVNGDNSDKLHLTDLSSWTNTNSTYAMNGNTYNVYHAQYNSMEVDLFVQQGIAITG